MYKELKSKLSHFLSSGQERTVSIKKNVIFSFLLKGLMILASLLLVPLTIKYVSAMQYGIWLTLSSIIGWFSLFDVGMWHGLKNKVAELNAHRQYEQSRVYISTAYILFFIVAVIIFSLFLIINSFIDWQKILNTTSIDNTALSHLSLLVVFVFCCHFFLQPINVVLIACHEFYKTSYLSLIGTILSLATVCVLLLFSNSGSLFYLTLAWGGMPLLVQLVASLYYFKGSYKHLAPSIKLVNFSYAKSLLNLGGAFFLLQIGALVLLQTDNIIITHVLGPQYVTDFNIAYKLFAIFSSIFTIIISPFWTAFTDAYAKNDFVWIQKSMKKMKQIWALLSVAVILVLVCSKWIFKLWMGDLANIPFSLSFALAISVIFSMWQTIHVYLLNGIGKVKVQLIVGSIMTAINIPLAIYLGERIGLAGVVTANTVVYAVTGIFCYRQCQHIINSNLQTGAIRNLESVPSY